MLIKFILSLLYLISLPVDFWIGINLIYQTGWFLVWATFNILYLILGIILVANLKEADNGD